MSGAMWWVARQIAAMSPSSAGATVAAPPYNPNPPGTIHEGSATDAVLDVLARYAPRFLTFSQIVDFTGKPAKSVSWSLCYLKSTGKIEARQSGDPRSPLYQMYRICP